MAHDAAISFMKAGLFKGLPQAPPSGAELREQVCGGGDLATSRVCERRHAPSGPVLTKTAPLSVA
jgi:hypothetical protein